MQAQLTKAGKIKPGPTSNAPKHLTPTVHQWSEAAAVRKCTSCRTKATHHAMIAMAMTSNTQHPTATTLYRLKRCISANNSVGIYSGCTMIYLENNQLKHGCAKINRLITCGTSTDMCKATTTCKSLAHCLSGHAL